MVVVDALLIVAMMFFLFLPITDRKTVRMKLFVVCAIATVLAVSVARTPAPDLQLAHAVASQYAVIGVLGAVRQARRTGRGQDIDISAQECIVAISGETGPLLWLDDLIMRRRVGNRRAMSAPFGHYPTQDGYVAIVAGMPTHWEAMAAWIVERTGNEGALDPSFRGGPQSRTGGARDVVNLFTEELTRTYLKQEFFEEAQRRGIPVTPVNTVASVALDPQLEERGFWARQRMPDGRDVRVPGAPFRMSATPWRRGDAPRPGAHTSEFLGELRGWPAPAPAKTEHTRQD